MAKCGDSSAFPTPDFYDGQQVGSTEGLTKRELFAAMALQGLLSSLRWEASYPDFIWENKGHVSDFPFTAVEMADRLIQALNSDQSQ